MYTKELKPKFSSPPHLLTIINAPSMAVHLPFPCRRYRYYYHCREEANREEGTGGGGDGGGRSRRETPLVRLMGRGDCVRLLRLLALEDEW